MRNCLKIYNFIILLNFNNITLFGKTFKANIWETLFLIAF